MTHTLIIGAGISGLAAAYRLRQLAPNMRISVIERAQRLGGKILTEHLPGGFLIEGAADSFLSRKARGIGLCRELGLIERMQGRDPRFNRTYVKFNGELHPLPAGLTGMIPTNLQAMTESKLLSEEGRMRLAQERDLPARPGDEDESLATFVSRRLGQEAWERMVEPLMSGIYAGDGRQLSLAATFPQLRQLEKKHGSLIRGLMEQSGKVVELHSGKVIHEVSSNQKSVVSSQSPVSSLQSPISDSQFATHNSQPTEELPTFVSLVSGMGELIERLADAVGRERIYLRQTVNLVRRTGNGYRVELEDGSAIQSDALIVTTPAHVTARLLAEIDTQLADLHAAIPHVSVATVSLSFASAEVAETYAGYGYVIPRIESERKQDEVLAVSWMSNKWTGRAPAEQRLLRVYLGRYGRADVTQYTDHELVKMARCELSDTLGIEATPSLQRIHRWPLAMPQYVLGHVERVAQIEARIIGLSGLFVAGAAYHGVGIPDCIAAGEAAAVGVVGK